MSIVGGWWISPKGKIHEIFEHRMFIEDNPGLFGFTLDEVIGKPREVLLPMAMKKGWVRVRGINNNPATYEFWEFNTQILKLIRMHLGHIKAWPNDQLKLSEVCTGRSWYWDADYVSRGAAKEEIIGDWRDIKRITPLLKTKTANKRAKGGTVNIYTVDIISPKLTDREIMNMYREQEERFKKEMPGSKYPKITLARRKGTRLLTQYIFRYKGRRGNYYGKYRLEMTEIAKFISNTKIDRRKGLIIEEIEPGQPTRYSGHLDLNTLNKGRKTPFFSEVLLSFL